ncbi:hypothetical protein A33Q_0183 [Indibacter alkaliphilus LW1]|uniref:Uncharacterized protein n=1 Tax=Indibacter alkaliphilus (strain CCUG 57479 / KCTC 22604 / LW1) TaxID=1189612 RepID=S2DLN5_INDAL|nr:hypothetical protein A33Q_0183 [Indibacter alkaliphilus LW1]
MLKMTVRTLVRVFCLLHHPFLSGLPGDGSVVRCGGFEPLSRRLEFLKS